MRSKFPLLFVSALALAPVLSWPAKADVVTLVCPHPTYTETIVIDFDRSTVRATVDLDPYAGHPSPVRAEITENYVRFPSPNGQFVDTLNRLTGELVMGANGKRTQCSNEKRKF